MKLASLKSIDLALDELEAKEGLPNFIPLADEIGKALRKLPASVKRDSVEKRKQQLKAARQGHDAELKTILAKSEKESLRLSPEGIEERRKRCAQLKQRAVSALTVGDVENAQICIDDLILDCPDDSEIPTFVGDLQKVSDTMEDEADRRKADNLGQVCELSAVSSATGMASISLTWRKGAVALADSFRIERVEADNGEKVELPSQFETQFVDAEVKLGIPYRYSVTPCYRLIPGKNPSLSNVVICTAPIGNFHVANTEGTETLGIVSLSWRNPPWDAAAKVETWLVREDGERWDVSGSDSFDDEDVRAGETHVYRLETTVSGMHLDPVECSVTVERVDEPPSIKGACVFMQEGRPKLSIPNWPTGVPEVVITRLGLEPRYLSREEYDSASFYFHSLEEVDAATIQAVHRFHGKHEVRGPASRIARPKVSSILFVSLDRRKKSLWSHEHGMRVCMDDGSVVPPLVVTIEKPNGCTSSFPVASGEIVPGEFFPFPAAWNAKCKDDVEVSVANAALCGEVIVRYRTSRILP